VLLAASSTKVLGEHCFAVQRQRPTAAWVGQKKTVRGKRWSVSTAARDEVAGKPQPAWRGRKTGPAQRCVTPDHASEIVSAPPSGATQYAPVRTIGRDRLTTS